MTGTHQGVTDCLSCHGPPPAGGWANVTIVGTASTNHMPIGNLDCNGSGCHTTTKVTAGGFRLGAASINCPDLERGRPHHRGRAGGRLHDLPRDRARMWG